MESRQDDKLGSSSWLPGVAQNERTSLLPKPADDEPTAGESYEIEDKGKSNVQVVAEEFWILFKSSVPVIAAYALQNSLQTISVLIVGRLSPEALSTAAFCYMCGSGSIP